MKFENLELTFYERKLTEINFLLKKADWTDEDESRYGPKIELPSLKKDLVNRVLAIRNSMTSRESKVKKFIMSAIMSPFKYLWDTFNEFRSISRIRTTKRAPMLTSREGSHIAVPSEYFSSSGSSTETILYCRKEVKELFAFF
jgi:hypothetical protein